MSSCARPANLVIFFLHSVSVFWPPPDHAAINLKVEHIEAAYNSWKMWEKYVHLSPKVQSSHSYTSSAISLLDS